jgi:hypothetical protein
VQKTRSKKEKNAKIVCLVNQTWVPQGLIENILSFLEVGIVRRWRSFLGLRNNKGFLGSAGFRVDIGARASRTAGVGVGKDLWNVLDDKCAQGWSRRTDQSQVQFNHGPGLDRSGGVVAVSEMPLNHNQTNNAGNAGDSTKTECEYGKIALSWVKLESPDEWEWDQPAGEAGLAFLSG